MSRWIDRRLIHSDASAESLAMVRVWVFGIWSVAVWADPITLAAGFPRELFAPVGPLWWLPGEFIDALLSPTGLAVLKAGTLVACLAACVGVATRVSVAIAAALLVVWESLSRGYLGFSNHAQIALVLGALALAFAPCDHALTLWPRRPGRAAGAAYQFPLVAIVAMICAAYLFIGANRLAYGGVELFQSNTLSEWILGINLRDADPASTAGVRWISNPVTAAIGNVGFPLLTLLEVSAPLCLLSSRYRWFFLPAMLLAQAGILVLMRIDFTELSLALLVFIDSRHWSPAAKRQEAPGVVYFDGVCGLCNRFVDFVLRRDRGRRLRVATLQGSTAAGRFGTASGAPATIVFEEDGEVLERSAAVLRILGRLGGPWSLLTFFGLIPRPVRDGVYDWVARHRYGWFGRRDTCRLPTAEERAVFLP